MCPIHDPDRSEGFSEESGEIRGFKPPVKNNQFFKDLINKANSVPLVFIFNHYKIRISNQDKKIMCPFSSKHNNGRDNTPSFNYYPDTNSFWCFGCKTGNKTCDFVASLENFSKAKAAYKIIKLYESEASFDDLEIDYGIDRSERLNILMDFSNFIRQKIQANCLSLDKIEKFTSVFDKMNNKHNLSNEALKSLIIDIKEKLD